MAVVAAVASAADRSFKYFYYACVISPALGKSGSAHDETIRYFLERMRKIFCAAVSSRETVKNAPDFCSEKPNSERCTGKWQKQQRHVAIQTRCFRNCFPFKIKMVALCVTVAVMHEKLTPFSPFFSRPVDAEITAENLIFS